MPALQFTIAVMMEDGSSYEVTADQRDIAKYEQQIFYSENATMTKIRFMAYSAAVRAGKTRLSWPKFDELCVEAGDPAKAEAADVDPTQREAPDAS